MKQTGSGLHKVTEVECQRQDASTSTTSLPAQPHPFQLNPSNLSSSTTSLPVQSAFYYIKLILLINVMHNSKNTLSMYCITQRKEWHSTLVSLPGESHGQRSLVGYSLVCNHEVAKSRTWLSDSHTHTHTHTHTYTHTVLQMGAKQEGGRKEEKDRHFISKEFLIILSSSSYPAYEIVITS